MGTAMAEAAAVCLEEIPHVQGTELAVRGSFNNSYGLEWDEVTEQGRRTFADLREATEFGAEGVAILLIKEETDYTTIERAAIGTRIDRWLGHESDAPNFQRRARLETSGILRGSDADIGGRLREKMDRLSLSDNPLPAFVVVVEFSHPLAEVGGR